MITQEYLKSRLRYEPETGKFFWIGSYGKGRSATGRIEAGHLREDGYIEIRINKIPYRAGQLAWLYMEGKFVKLVEHEDRCRSNNKWSNLRVATHAQNSCNRPKQTNNKSGFKGVFWNNQAKAWQAKAQLNGKQYHFGYHLTVEEANEAAIVGRNKLHGLFACH